MKKFARKCDVTGRGMNKGFVIGNGEMYIKDDSDMLAHVIEQGYSSMDEAYDDEYYYYTEWNDKDDYEWVEVEEKIGNEIMICLYDIDTFENKKIFEKINKGLGICGTK
jgi:hypothetical protein